MTDDLVSLSSVTGPLELVKESWLHRDFRLQGPQGELVADLQYGPVGGAVGRAKGATWHFSRAHGLIHHDVDVTAEGSDETLAHIGNDTWTHGGSLVLQGISYEIVGEGVWQRHWALKRDGEEQLAVEQAAVYGTKPWAHVTVTEAGRQDPNAVLLALLMVHAMVMYQQAGAGIDAGLITRS